ncbi:MAG: Ig-like domain-containing protein [Cyclobacteriaceae bacterium]
MKRTLQNSAFTLLSTLVLLFGLSSCDDEDLAKDETFSSNEFRILKIEEGNNIIEQGEQGVSAVDLSLVATLSHPVDPATLAAGLSITGGANISVTLDETNSIATLAFDQLDYQTGYTLTLDAGVYGLAGAALRETYRITFRTRAFISPVVTLSAENVSPGEGTATEVFATLNTTTTEPVIINLTFAGTAIIGEDYTTDSQSITINAGETSGSINLTVVDDDLVEGQEFAQVSIISLVNGIDNGQVLSLNILDNDVALELSLKGILALEWTTSGTNGGKALHFKALEDIADLSDYAIGVANNGGGTDSIEYRFPSISVSQGDDILLAREDATLTGYFGSCATSFEHVIQTDEMNQNGNDAIELYSGTTIIETYGDVNVDGAGQTWDYTGSWAYKLGGEWVYGGVGCAAASTTFQDSNCTYPLCASGLQLQGVMSFQTGADASNRERAIHLRANRDIADISVYGIGIPNNGGGSDGREMDLPAISVAEGDNILFIRDEDLETIETYFGTCFSKFDHTAVDPGINFNGDDGVELYLNADVIEVYGDVVDDGTGLFWEYDGSWAFKQTGDNWTYAGVGCASGFDTNASAGCPYAFCD